MEDGGWASLADLALKAGVPTALGCAIVWYLLWHHIPKMMTSFERAIDEASKTNAAQREECKSALSTQAASSREFVELVRAQIKTEAEENRAHRAEEGRRTREAIAGLTKQTHRLAESVYRAAGGRPALDRSLDSEPELVPEDTPAGVPPRDLRPRRG